MKQRNIFTKSRKEAPVEEVSKNAQLLIRSGYIHKEMAGVYDILPYGLRVMNKIQNIVRQEMDNIGGQEISMTALQDSNLWKKTNRWDDAVVDNWFKTKFKNKNEVGLAFTHEEPITNLMKNHITSYKDLPVLVYQFQTKFRNELRAKSGLIRGREFLMKDLYSFCLTQNDHEVFYQKVADAYTKIFQKVGIGEITYRTFASGGTFSKFSHEFQAVCESGEDTIYLHRAKNIAVNEEVMNAEVLGDLSINQDELEKLKTVEVGNIFSLSDKFSTPLELVVDNQNGNRTPVYMGSYGMGIGRLMAVIAETHADEKGLVWPASVAPFDCHLINLLDSSDKTDGTLENLYHDLLENNIDVLFDDRDLSAGQKLKESDLIGIPYQLIFGRRYQDFNEVEFITRRNGEIKYLKVDEIRDVLLNLKNN